MSRSRQPRPNRRPQPAEVDPDAAHTPPRGRCGSSRRTRARGTSSRAWSASSPSATPPTAARCASRRPSPVPVQVLHNIQIVRRQRGRRKRPWTTERRSTKRRLGRAGGRRHRPAGSVSALPRRPPPQPCPSFPIPPPLQPPPTPPSPPPDTTTAASAPAWAPGRPTPVRVGYPSLTVRPASSLAANGSNGVPPESLTSTATVRGPNIGLTNTRFERCWDWAIFGLSNVRIDQCLV